MSENFYYLGKRVYYDPYSTRLDIKKVDLISSKALLSLKDNDFSAFGVGLPKRVILEVFEFHKRHKDDFSHLVKKYPFSQVIFSQWLTIKLYERQKELTKDFALSYKEFLKNFTSTFNRKPYNLISAMGYIHAQEINYASYDQDIMIGTLMAKADTNIITLYDIIYDIIPNSIRKVFLKDEESLKAYLPLNQERFFYEEEEWGNPKTAFEGSYINKIPKEYYQSNKLYLKNYVMDSLIPKAKINKLGIGYDELLELINKDETSLDYPKIWEFRDVEAPEIKAHPDYVELSKSDTFGAYKTILDKQKQATWKDVIYMQQSFAPYADSYLSLYTSKTWDRGSVYISSEDITEIAAKQYFQSSALIEQNNFHTEYAIFESLRQKMREDEELDLDYVSLQTRYGGATSRFEASQLQINIYLSFRFNQALALAFLNAYDKGRNEI